MMDVENYYSKDMPEHALELYRRLDAELKRRKLIDFDDMMVLCAMNCKRDRIFWINVEVCFHISW